MFSSSSPLFVPKQFNQDASEGGAIMMILFLGLVSGAALLGALGGFVLTAAVRELHRQYQCLARRGYYGYERQRDDARRRFEVEVSGIRRSPSEARQNYDVALQAYYGELDRIDAEQRREPERGFRPSGAAVWASPKALAFRNRRRTQRTAHWRKWAKKFTEAVCLGKEPPTPPSGRRGGNGGAPIRRLCERSTNPPPTPEELVAQWEKARGRAPAEEKVRLGSMMLDIEATVDSSLVRNTDGEIVGRRPGVRGWLREKCPEMERHYRVLMDCRRLADDFRRAHGLRDPHPATALLGSEPPDSLPPALRKAIEPRHAAARKLLSSPAGRHANALAKAIGGIVRNTVGERAEPRIGERMEPWRTAATASVRGTGAATGKRLSG